MKIARIFLGELKEFLQFLLLLPIYVYQKLISPMLPPTCRFRPTCSQYAVSALKIHGPFKGLYLASRRILKCHPWHPGGDDPVPPVKNGNADL